MPLSFRVETIAHNEVRRIGDDGAESFMEICRRSIGKTHMLGYVIPYGDTMFNGFQLRRFLTELDSLSATEMLSEAEVEVIARVREVAEEAMRIRGYLFILGE